MSDECQGHKGKEYEEYMKEMLKEYRNSYGGYVTAFIFYDNKGKPQLVKSKPVCNFKGECKKPIEDKLLMEFVEKINGEHVKDLITDLSYFEGIKGSFAKLSRLPGGFIPTSTPNPVIELTMEELQDLIESMLMTAQLLEVIAEYEKHGSKLENVSEKVLVNLTETLAVPLRRCLAFMVFMVAPPYRNVLNQIIITCGCERDRNIEDLFDNSGEKFLGLVNNELEMNDCGVDRPCGRTVYKSNLQKEEKMMVIFELWVLYVISKGKHVCVNCRKTHEEFRKRCDKCGEISDGLYKIIVCNRCKDKVQRCPVCSSRLNNI